MTATARRQGAIAAGWTSGLVTVLGACLVLMAVSAAPIVTVLLGVAGGIAVLIAPWLPPRRRTVAVLLLLTPIPFAIATWWSLVTPLVVLLAAVIGWFTIDRRPSSRRAAVVR